MDFLRKFLKQSQVHLSGLSTSQRLVLLLSGALVAVALMLLTNWASTPVLVALIDQPLPAQELDGIVARLDAEGVTYKLAGDTVMVPAEQRRSLLARLSQSNILPKDISLGFSQILESSSPWLSMDDQNRRWALALSNELAGVIKEFEGVVSASVFIDKNMKRTIGTGSIKPTASVSVTLQSGRTLEKDHVFAMASFVSSAVAGLDVYDVSVTDRSNFRSYSVPRAEDGMASNDLDVRRQKEKPFEEKIRGLLANVPNLRVMVFAELDPEHRIVTDRKHGKPVEQSEETESLIETRSTPAGGPGVNPNVSVNVAGGPAVDQMEKKRSRTDYVSGVDETTTKSEVLRNGIKNLYASVNVPRSYFASIFARANDGKDPTDEELNGFLSGASSEKDKIQRLIRNALALSEESKQVDVDWFHDEYAIAMTTGEAQAGTSGTMLALVDKYGGQAGLAAMALMSLMMMLMMVRRASEGPVLPGEMPPTSGAFTMGPDGKLREEDGVEPLMAEEMPIGEAALGEDLLEGQEMDEQELRMRQVIEQVSELIKDDPETSVGILKRWINSDSD